MLTSENVDIPDVMTLFMCLLSIILITVLLVSNTETIYRYPPGPRGLPIFGNLLTENLQVIDTYRDFRRRYGDYYTLKFGTKPIVVVNGYENLKKILITRQELFSDRPSTFKETANHAGLFSSSGKTCSNLRTCVLRPLVFYSKYVMERDVEEERRLFLNIVEEHHGEPFDTHRLIKIHITNITCRVVFGSYYHYDDPEFQKLIKDLFDGFDSARMIFLMNFYPKLQYIFNNPFNTQTVFRCFADLLEIVRHKVTEHKATFDEYNPRDMIDEILITQNRSDKNANLSDENISCMIRELFVAGVDTSAAVLCWTILFLIHNPEVQEKCYEEVHRVVGTSRLPTMEDQKDLPYIQAVINEGLRCGNVGPLGVPHATTEDTYLDDYYIPKGTTIFPSLDSITFDQEIFPNPEKFHPERFIGKDGKFTGADKVLVFSMGKRKCVGEKMSRMVLFSLLSAVVQRFELKMEDSSKPPSLKGTLGISQLPSRYRVRAILRK